MINYEVIEVILGLVLLIFVYDTWLELVFVS